MIDLENFPEAILEAKDGEIFTLQGHKLKLYTQSMYCYLSSIVDGEETFVCVSNTKKLCLFSPQEMVELIKSKEWVLE